MTKRSMAFACAAILALASPLGRAGAAARPWGRLKHLAGAMPDPLADRAEWERRDAYFYASALSPGILLRMKTPTIRFFAGLDEHGAQGPQFLVVPARGGARALEMGRPVAGTDLAESWIVASFQGAKGWEQFDAPWFLSLERRPKRIVLTRDGLEIEFARRDTGHIFSMPLYGYFKPPQQGSDLCAKHNLPHRAVRPWQWRRSVPAGVVERCRLWSRIAKAWPAGFRESFSVDPAADEITFRQDYRWLVLRDDWGTRPLRFAPLSPTLGLAWRCGGFPMQASAKVHDPDMMTAFGPYVGAYDADRLEIAMKVLQYTHELERLDVPASPTPPQQAALRLLRDAMKSKFPDAWRFRYDHGSRDNFVWNIVADVWYAKGLPFVDADLRKTAAASLRVYLANDVLRPHSPHHGKYILHGPGIGSWGSWGDAGKFASNSLQPIWAFGQYAGGWDLLRQRWDLIKRFFITPEEANWVFYGRGAIAEMGDEAPPCSAYARMAWALKDHDEYLFGAYAFARELVHHHVKQLGGRYFYEHQPYQPEASSSRPLRPMPPRVYPTDLWGSTMGWQVDGPIYERAYSREHQSANRWVRFHDPDTGRFYRDHLADAVREELDWYTRAARRGTPGLYRADNYTGWLRKDTAHILTSLARLRSFLLGERYEQLSKAAPRNGYGRPGGAAAIALGYAYLRSMVPVKHERLVPKSQPASPFVLGLERRGPEDHLHTAQTTSGNGLEIRPTWYKWDMPRARPGSRDRSRCFGRIAGDFGGRVAGLEGSRWICYGCRVAWTDTAARRDLPDAEAILRRQERTPVLAIGPFANDNDDEIVRVAYPPEKGFDRAARYPGARGAVSWKPAELGPGRQVDLGRALPAPGERPGRAIAYVQQYVWAPDEADVYLMVGHYGGVQAWIDRQRVLSLHGPHGRFQVDRDRAPGRLRKGWNRVLVKLVGSARELRAQFRLTGLDRQPLPDLKFAAEPAR